MNKLVLTSSDLKEIVKNIFDSDLGDNAPTLSISNANGELRETDIKNFLNIEFYSWKNRLIHENNGEFKKADDWVASLNFYMDKSYALVELTDKELTASQDVDAGTLYGRITFLIQAHKADALDYLTSMISSYYAGNPQEIEDSLGKKYSVYLLLGQLMYDEQPSLEQLGEVIQCSCNFSLSYLSGASTYRPDLYELSFDGETYYELPLSEGTQQVIYSGDTVPMQRRVDVGGKINNIASNVQSFSFFDFDNELTKKINEIYYKNGAYSKDGVLITEKIDVNPVVYIRTKDYSNQESGSNEVPTYVYRMTIDTIIKNIVNSSFLSTTITLKPYGKRVV